ncbi:MAG TPA: hypothetical protein VEQ65_00745, partial [Opitutus sp.]|nr:hypothetical protein [Opitutus sp.]
MPVRTTHARTTSTPQRWRRLPPTAQALLVAFALHPAPLPGAWLPKLAPEDASVDTLAAAGWIVEEEDGRWALRDDALRAAVVRLARWSVRQAQHRALAQLCRAKAGCASWAARHWQSAGDEPAACAAWIHSAIEQAAADGARAAECL